MSVHNWERLEALQTQRKRRALDLETVSMDLPAVEELMPRLRAKLQEFESTIMADVPLGRLALGGLIGDDRLRIYADGRIEGAVTLAPEALHPPKRAASGGADRVVAGGRYARVCLPVPIILPVRGSAALQM